MKKFIGNILTLLVSLIVSLLLAEFVVRMFYPQNLSGSWMVEHESGLVLNKPEGDTKHQFNDVKVEYTFDKFNNRKLVPEPNYEQERVLLLGDSYSFGWLLPDTLTYAYHFQRKYSNRSLINSSVGGWGSADYCKYIELFGKEMKPAQIMIFVNSDDIGRAIRSPLYVLKEDGSLEAGTPPKKNKMKAFLNAIPFYNWLLTHSHFFSLARNFFLSNPTQMNVKNPVLAPTTELTDSTQIKKGVALAEALFLKIKKETEGCNSKLKVVYNGWLDLNDTTNYNSNPTMVFLREAKKNGFFEKNGISFTDLSDSRYLKDVHAHLNDYIIPVDGHPNGKGARMIFNAAIEKLEENK